MSRYRMTLVNRLGEGRSILLDDEKGEPWASWDAAIKHSALYRYGCLIELHHGRVLALHSDGVEAPERTEHPHG